MLNEIRCQQHTHVVNSSIIQWGLGEFLSPGSNYIRPAILDEEWNLCLARIKEYLTSSINNCSPTTIDLWSANLTAGWGYGNCAAGKMQTCWLNICWKPLLVTSDEREANLALCFVQWPGASGGKELADLTHPSTWSQRFLWAGSAGRGHAFLGLFSSNTGSKIL